MDTSRRHSPQLPLVASLALLFAFHVALPTARAQNPSQVGAWGPPFPLPLIAIHSALLPTGEVLLFSAEHGVPGIHAWLLDPTTLALTDVPPPAPWNPDCAGHSFLPDGRLLVAGGTLSFNPLTGARDTFLFDPYAQEWTRIEDMASGRWYPTSVTLGDGSVLAMSGLSEVPGAPNSDIELWSPNATSNWQLLGLKALPYYPLLHLLPTGSVFLAGPDPLAETYDPSTDTWTPVASTNFPGRYEACSVLLPPTLERVMVIGGFAGSGQPTSTAEIIDISEPMPQWRGTTHMAFRRMEHDAVLLPNGQVLVVGGRSNYGSTPTPVLTPEIFDPATETWQTVAPHAVPRRYHSSTLLLPDGRVLAAGGDYQPSGEIYSPPYLFRGPRPTISAAPAAIAYATSFPIGFTSAHATNSAVLLRPSAVTHSNNMTQRYVPLGPIGGPGVRVGVAAPARGDVAPPGFYMLFVVDDAGVPSVSRTVRVITRFGDFNQDNDVDLDDHAAFASCFTGPGAGPLPPLCEPGDFDSDGDVDCEDWEQFRLAWTEPGDPPGLLACPATYCVAAANSAGPGAWIGYGGSVSVAANDFTLEVGGAPPNQFGVFFYGPAQVQIPLGDGFRCVGAGAIGLFRLVPAQLIDPAGNALRLVDLTLPPAGSGAGSIAPGSTWNFQFWYRDPPGPGGSGSNLSNALRVTFYP